MAVQSEIFSTEYGVRSFISTKHIATKQHMSVWLQRRSDNIWVQLSTSNYELINNSAVLTQAPNSTTYSIVEIRVADTPDELGPSPSEIAVLAGLHDEIVALNGIKNDITTVSGISGDVTTVSSNILDINSVATNIVPNLAEILQADTNATIATTKATEASASATSAATSASIATNRASIATDEAIIATTKASEASASEASALSSKNASALSEANAKTSETNAATSEANALAYKNSASNSATTATTQAGIATTKASEASTSASNALASEAMADKWANNQENIEVTIGKYSAYHWSQKAKDFASGSALAINYDNTASGLTATNIQIAIDELSAEKAELTALNTKQDTLVSGTNIKTINSTSLLGSGNISVVSLTGDETISGTKTFSNTIIGNASTATTATNLNGGYGTFSGLITTKLCNSAFNVASDNALSVRGDATYPAYINFHRAGAYAANFGIDTDNKLKFGGWSAGSVYEIYHQGNQPPSVGVGQTWQDVTASRVAGTAYTNTTGKPIEVSVSATAGGGSFFINGIIVGTQNGTQICSSSFVIPNGATYSTNYAIIKWSELR